MVQFDASGSYSVRLLQGTYDVLFRGNESQVGYTSYSQRSPLMKDAELSADVDRSFDIRTSIFSGTLTLDGESWPSGGISGDDYHRELIFIRNDVSSSFPKEFGADGEFEVRLIEGVYDTWFWGNESNTGDSQQSIVVEECRTVN